MDILKAFVSWSGGKESSLALYRAKREGVNILFLLNMIAEDGKYSRSHGIKADLIKAQAEAMGIPIIQRATNWENYEREFKDTVMSLRKEGINSGVFGDIDLEQHRDWVERVCREIEIKALLPLWGEERENLLNEFINLGFKAFVCAVNPSFLDDRWLGREIDFEFIRDLKSLGGVDLCGEKGEYHTFVYDGPIFKERVKFSLGKKLLKDRRWIIEIEKI